MVLLHSGEHKALSVTDDECQHSTPSFELDKRSDRFIRLWHFKATLRSKLGGQERQHYLPLADGELTAGKISIPPQIGLRKKSLHGVSFSRLRFGPGVR
jgi:hypothetical protein